MHDVVVGSRAGANCDLRAAELCADKLAAVTPARRYRTVPNSTALDGGARSSSQNSPYRPVGRLIETSLDKLDHLPTSRKAFLTRGLAYGLGIGHANAQAAAPIARAELESYVRSLADAIPVPGAAVALLSGHVDTFAVGTARAHVATSPSSVFEAASLSKPVFALGVLALVQDGSLRLDSPIASIVELRDETDDPRVLRITPRHALTHTTGLPNWRFVSGRLQCAFEPGSRFSYSGEGIFLLQRAVERIVGTGFAYHMRRRVLEPLGMRSSSFAFDPSFEHQMAVPHDSSGMPSERRTLLLGRQLVALARRRGVALEHWTWNDMRCVLPTLDPPQKALPVHATINAASSLLTTVRDYARAASAVARNRTMNVPQIAVCDRIAWGLGVGLESSRDRSAFHWGDNDGFKALFVADRHTDGAVILTNGDSGMKLALRAISKIDPQHPLLAWVGAMYR